MNKALFTPLNGRKDCHRSRHRPSPSCCTSLVIKAVGFDSRLLSLFVSRRVVVFEPGWTPFQTPIRQSLSKAPAPSLGHQFTGPLHTSLRKHLEDKTDFPGPIIGRQDDNGRTPQPINKRESDEMGTSPSPSCHQISGIAFNIRLPSLSSQGILPFSSRSSSELIIRITFLSRHSQTQVYQAVDASETWATSLMKYTLSQPREEGWLPALEGPS